MADTFSILSEIVAEEAKIKKQVVDSPDLPWLEVLRHEVDRLRIEDPKHRSKLLCIAAIAMISIKNLDKQDHEKDNNNSSAINIPVFRDPSILRAKEYNRPAAGKEGPEVL